MRCLLRPTAAARPAELRLCMLSRLLVRPTAVARPVRLVCTLSRRSRPERPSTSAATEKALEEEAEAVSASAAGGSTAPTATHGTAAELDTPGSSADVVSSPSSMPRPAETASLLARLGVGGSSGAAANAPQRLFAALQLQTCSDSELRQVFGWLDADGDGAVTEEDLRVALRRSFCVRGPLSAGATGEAGAGAGPSGHGAAAGAGAGAAAREAEPASLGMDGETRDIRWQAEEDAAVQLVMEAADSKVPLPRPRRETKKHVTSESSCKGTSTPTHKRPHRPPHTRTKTSK